MTNGHRALALAALGAGALAARRLGTPRYRLEGRTVLITGGSRGLGLALARECARQGARLALCARDAVELVHARDELAAAGATVSAHTCDVRDREEVAALVKDVIAAHDRIDVLVNNAGVIEMGPFEVMTVDDFEISMATHFWGPLHAILEVLPAMKARREGRIVNIASVGGKVAFPHLVPYCASKFALVGLSEALHAELKKEGVRVTTVCPGLMRTGSSRNAYFKGKNEAEHALFSIAASLPFVTLDADRAARRIVAALRRGDAEVGISLPSRLATALQALSPGLAAEMASLLDRALPAPGGIGAARLPGSESTSRVAPSVLTRLNDKAAERNNEIPHPLRVPTIATRRGAPSGQSSIPV